jgi:hypothetical protein
MPKLKRAFAATVAASFLATYYTAHGKGSGKGAQQCLYNVHFADGTVIIDKPGAYK